MAFFRDMVTKVSAKMQKDFGDGKRQTKEAFWKSLSQVVKEGGEEREKLSRLKYQLDMVYKQIPKRFIDDDDEGSSERLEDYLELKHLEELRELFRRHQPARDESEDHLPEYKRSKKIERSAGFLTLEEFKAFIYKVVGRGNYESQLDKLFVKLDTSCDGYVDWSEFCTYILLYLKENDGLQGKKDAPFKSDAKIRHIVYNRAQPTTRILMTENPQKLLSISKEGVVCSWDQSTHLETFYSMETEDLDALGNKKRFHEWVMEVVFMRNCHKLAMSTSGREIKFFDYISGALHEDVHLFGLPSVAMCMDYYYNPKNPNDPSHLFCGDDVGRLYHIIFHKPTSSLFDLPHIQDQIQKVWVNDLDQHANCVTFNEHKGPHDEAIHCVRYIPDNECVITCSSSARNSVCIYDIYRRHTMYTFKQKRGVECFSLSRTINLLATGSSDYVIRVWNPYVVNQPSAELLGHHAPILSIIIHEKLGMIFSYSRDSVLKVWEIKEFTCIQTVPVRVPSMATGKLPDYMNCPMTVHLQTAQVFLAVGDYMVVFKLGKPPDPPPLLSMTHKTPLCAALYNSNFKQVITGCDDSTMTSWDLETGIKCLVFNNAHDGEEITCLTFDWTGRKLISGARNGSVKIWNFQNGHNMQRLETVSEVEVTAVVPLKDQQLFLTLGWSRQVAKYTTETPDTFLVKKNLDWKGGIVHKEDILAVDYCCPLLLATGSYDGELIIWSLETERILFRLRGPRTDSLDKSMRRVQNLPSISGSSRASSSRATSSVGNSRPNSRHRKTHKPPTDNGPSPIDKLLFLAQRVPRARKGGAILISSEAGTIQWWSLYGKTFKIGHFYAASEKDESVLAMCTDPKNALLVTGDTRGIIRIWHIEDYCLLPDQLILPGTQPAIVREWSGHPGAVVSLDYADHEIGSLIISASIDCTARLFTIRGECIGIFGQKTAWNLENTKTWMEYASLEECHVDTQPAEDKDEALETEDTEGDFSQTFVTKLPKVKTNEIPSSPHDVITNEEKELTDLTAKINDHTGLSDPIKTAPVEVLGLDIHHWVSNVNQKSDTDKSTKDEIKPDWWKRFIDRRVTEPILGLSRSWLATVLVGSLAILSECTLYRRVSMLGSKADNDFERIRCSRQHRRERFAEIDNKKSRLYGSKCSPFQALNTVAFQSMMVRERLPMAVSRNPRNFGQEPDIGSASGPDELREVDPFLRNFEELRGDPSQSNITSMNKLKVVGRIATKLQKK